jgi:hypothetical protein
MPLMNRKSFGRQSRYRPDIVQQVRQAMLQRSQGAASGDNARGSDADNACDNKTPAGQATADKWLMRLREISRMITRSSVDARMNPYARFAVDRIYADGEIHGICTEQDETFQLFVHCGEGLPPAGCSCRASQGRYPCTHISGFVYFVTRHLSEHYSRIRRCIERGEYSSDPRDRERFSPDYELEAISSLDELLQDSRPEPVINDALPPLAEHKVQRLVWDVSVDDEQIAVVPIIQQGRKRGSGFTKGKRIALEQLKDSSDLPLSSADRRIVDSIRLGNDTYSYRPNWSLNPAKAVERLIGQPNVTLEGQPCRIERREFCLSLTRKHDQRWAFALTID